MTNYERVDEGNHHKQKRRHQKPPCPEKKLDQAHRRDDAHEKNNKAQSRDTRLKANRFDKSKAGYQTQALLASHTMRVCIDRSLCKPAFERHGQRQPRLQCWSLWALKAIKMAVKRYEHRHTDAADVVVTPSPPSVRARSASAGFQTCPHRFPSVWRRETAVRRGRRP